MRNIKVVIMGNRQLAIQLMEFCNSNQIQALPVANPSDDGLMKDGLPSFSNYLEQKNISYLRPKSLKDPQSVDIQAIKKFEPDLIVSCSYEKIIPRYLIDLPKLNAVNIHFAMLPKNRGCMPVVWGILDQANCGVTIHKLSDTLDTGDILYQTPIKLKSGETAKDLYLRSANIGGKMLQELIRSYQMGKSIPSIKQDASSATYNSFNFPYDRWLQWNLGCVQIANIINALTHLPHPCGRTNYNGEEIGILGPSFPAQKTNTVVGKVSLFGNRCTIDCHDGTVEFQKVFFRNQSLPAGEVLKDQSFVISPEKELKPT